jgi:23S rRNA pseudouridine955/2504/2580 synthase
MKARTGKEATGRKGSNPPAEQSARAAVRHVTIGPNEAGQRIDNFLITALKGVPKSHIYRVLRKGEVRVNKGRVKAQYRLQAGDELRIPPVRVAPESDAPDVSAPRAAELVAHILYEDTDLLVLDKPSGWAVHGGSGVAYGVIEALRVARPDLPNLELVHRLDRETSGCLLLAKHRAALLALHDALRNGAVDKHYLALVQGRWPSSLRRVDVALRKNVLRSGERIVAGDEDGKAAESEFHVRNAYRQASLVEVHLLTGRTHQIRVHAAHAGHPLAGDSKYGDAEFNKTMKAQGLRRLFLHAHTVAVDSPSTGRRLTFTAPLPEELAAVLRGLEHR